MENLYLAAVDNDEGFFPEVVFDAEKEYLSFEGDCNPIDTEAYFEPIFAWITAFLQTEGRKIIMRYKMGYLNSSSSRRLYDILHCLEQYHITEKGSLFLSFHADASDPDSIKDTQWTTEDLKCPYEIVLYNEPTQNE